MVAVSGNEFSSGHHRNALFAQIDGNPGGDEAATIAQVAEAGGLVQLNHPGRYSKGTSWYTELLVDHPCIVSLEVYNQGDRYPDDRSLWDDILTETMPERPVWGTSNDDMHRASHLFHNYNVFYVTELSESALRVAMTQGRSSLSYEPGGSGDALAPRIDSIVVDGASITINAVGCDSITWIASRREVATGAVVDVDALVQAGHVSTYLRARLDGPNGVTCTQPFGILPEASRTIVMENLEGSWIWDCTPSGERSETDTTTVFSGLDGTRSHVLSQRAEFNG